MINKHVVTLFCDGCYFTRSASDDLTRSASDDLTRSASDDLTRSASDDLHNISCEAPSILLLAPLSEKGSVGESRKVLRK